MPPAASKSPKSPKPSNPSNPSKPKAGKKTASAKTAGAKRAGARTLSGIVRSVGGGSIGGTEKWDLVVFLSPWREGDGPVVKKEVRLIVPVGTRAAVSRAIARWVEGEAVAVSVTHVGERKGFKWWDAHGSGRLRAADRAPFTAEVQRQAKVRAVEDEDLGKLTLERAYDWFNTKRRIGRKAYDLHVEAADPDDDVKVRRTLRSAAPRVLEVEATWDEILELCAKELLDTYNEGWREGGRPLSADGFKKRLALTSMIVAPGRTTLYIASGDLFGDHGVEVRIPHRGKTREVLVS